MNKKALALLSGGLDSTVAIKLLLEQGIEIEAINYVSPFCNCDRKDSCQHEANIMSKILGVPLKVFATGMEYLEIIKNPKFGYGKNMNPCIDCRIFMFNKTKEYMKESGASFLITGEVLGQRPKSQRRDALNTIERETGLRGLILRPLSAKLLPPTIPETEKIVDREKLLAIKGRGRREQMDMAEKYNIKDYLCAAGGCLLTDKNFVLKLKDLFKYKEDDSIKNLNLLRIGRHFRSSTGKKIIVGRNEEDNSRLEKYASSDSALIHLTNNTPGPLVMIPKNVDDITKNEAAGLCLYYSKDKEVKEVIYKYKDTTDTFSASIISSEKLEEIKIN